MLLDLPLGHAAFGKASPCPRCHNWLSSSRLTSAEQQRTLAELPWLPPQIRFAGQAMVSDPYGFLTLYGPPGTGKSELMVALVAEFCRRGIEAQYWHGAEIAAHFEDRDSQELWLARLSALPVLCIEEFDDLYQKLAVWNRPLLSSLIDNRYRHKGERYTLLTMQSAPEAWACPVDICSRLNDGRFYRDLEGETVPGLLALDGPDMRSYLRR